MPLNKETKTKSPSLPSRIIFFLFFFFFFFVGKFSIPVVIVGFHYSDRKSTQLSWTLLGMFCRSQQCCGLDSFYSFSNFQFSWFLSSYLFILFYFFFENVIFTEFLRFFHMHAFKRPIICHEESQLCFWLSTHAETVTQHLARSQWNSVKRKKKRKEGSKTSVRHESSQCVSSRDKQRKWRDKHVRPRR